MKKKMNKVLVVCTAAAAMTAFSGTAFGATLDLESKTAVADAKDGAGDIQEAINQISGNGNKDGWTIKIKSGTYDRFTIPADFKNITVEGEKRSEEREKQRYSGDECASGRQPFRCWRN